MGITKTVAIVDSDGSRRIINETDFDKRKHKLYVEEAPKGDAPPADGGKGK